ncbi:diguanylate cyclase [Pseudoxanthomonas sp. PXM02]|uniref:diguanylate cyclase n=1 Tax=Pseudoxanthomonas sp. PXM02 TaxID=2769294 RepID=UPI00177D36CD|nr:diguanylate cyclase [Pseudoxanthomonas sp. PXM02]MBD9479919.1 diguanylate cyclase [Pseudoxanthomonas sp. PXM02]
MPSDAARDMAEQNRSRYGLRMYRMRALGLGLGFLCVGAVLYEHTASPALWALLVANGFLWPHLAYLRVKTQRSEPLRAEFQNLTFDAAMGGFWIAAMHFDALPSVLLAVMLTMDKVIIGGGRFGVRTLGAMVLTCLAASAAWGFAFEPYTSYPVVLACLPFLAIYPMAIGVATHSLARKARQQKDLLEKMARFDAATGLMNRQQWLHAATNELKRYQRVGRTAVLVLIDIDRFKDINDGYGHTVGDEVVEEFARLLKACLRDVDTGGRYGGDEFGVVMPDTRWEEAIVAAERLRRQVAACAFSARGLRCTVSIGLAESHAGIGSVSDWINSADSALYRAKAQGRDCIVVGC